MCQRRKRFERALDSMRENSLTPAEQVAEFGSLEGAQEVFRLNAHGRPSRTACCFVGRAIAIGLWEGHCGRAIVIAFGAIAPKRRKLLHRPMPSYAKAIEPPIPHFLGRCTAAANPPTGGVRRRRRCDTPSRETAMKVEKAKKGMKKFAKP